MLQTWSDYLIHPKLHIRVSFWDEYYHHRPDRLLHQKLVAIPSMVTTTAWSRLDIFVCWLPLIQLLQRLDSLSSDRYMVLHVHGESVKSEIFFSASWLVNDKCKCLQTTRVRVEPSYVITWFVSAAGAILALVWVRALQLLKEGCACLPEIQAFYHSVIKQDLLSGKPSTIQLLPKLC